LASSNYLEVLPYIMLQLAQQKVEVLLGLDFATFGVRQN
jgi:hypothetical protein